MSFIHLKQKYPDPRSISDRVRFVILVFGPGFHVYSLVQIFGPVRDTKNETEIARIGFCTNEITVPTQYFGPNSI